MMSGGTVSYINLNLTTIFLLTLDSFMLNAKLNTLALSTANASAVFLSNAWVPKQQQWILSPPQLQFYMLIYQVCIRGECGF